MKNSDSPSLYALLVIWISEKFSYPTGGEPSQLSKTRFTSAMPIGGALSDPEKMTSSSSFVLIMVGAVSPTSHLIASTMFDLPEPFGPTMAVTPSEK